MLKNIIRTYSLNNDNLCIDFELKVNEAIIVGSKYLVDQLSKNGVIFKEMYPGLFIVTSLNGNSTMQNIAKIDSLIILSDHDELCESHLVAQMTKQQMDYFFQKFYWTESQRKKMNLIDFKYCGSPLDIDPGSLLVTYQQGKKGPLFRFKFKDNYTELSGYIDNTTRIEDAWGKYLFDTTVKPWLEKSKLHLQVLCTSSHSLLQPHTSLLETRSQAAQEPTN